MGFSFMRVRKRFCAALLAVSATVFCLRARAAALPVHIPWDTPPAAAQYSGQHTIQDFPVIYQMPELPTGCEVTALTMALRYYGCDVSKTDMADQYLPTASPSFYYIGGSLCGPDINSYFVGSPFSTEGYACGAPAMCTAASSYFTANNVNMQAKDITGYTPERLYALLEQDVPVVVLVTINMVDHYPDFSWYSPDGKHVSLGYNDHGAVLIGYGPDTVTLADPLAGEVTYSRSQFESVFRSRGSQCLILQKAENISGYTDVPDTSWFACAVNYCLDAGLMGGAGEKLFLPEGAMTRSMLADAMDRLCTASAENTGPGQLSLLLAHSKGIATGFSGGLSGADTPVTREQVISALWRCAGEPEVPPGLDFDDESAISEYAAAAVDWARENGIVSGKSGNRFDPKGGMTRAETAVVLYNYMNLEQKDDNDA